MTLKEFRKYLVSTGPSLYHNFQEVFAFSREDYLHFLQNLLVSLKYYAPNIKLVIDVEVFSIENLNHLKKFFADLQIEDDIRNQVLVKSPIIVLFANKISDIYAIFKNDIYRGYTLLQDNQYCSYMFNEKLDRNIWMNNYVVDMMLQSLKDLDKEDYVRMFQELEQEYSLKNYYFKTSRKK